MAAKKKASKKKKAEKSSALARRSATALTTEQAERFSRYLKKDKESAEVEAGGFPFISTKGAQFRFNDEPLPNPLRVVILGAMKQNMYYDGEYDESNPVPPTCHALNINDDENTMGPPADLPGRIHDLCVTCEFNAWNSGRGGKGKACKNTLKLAVLPYDGVTNFSKTDGARLSLPPTALKPWAPYARGILKGFERPLFTVVTEIGLKPSPKNNMAFSFDFIEAIEDDETLAQLEERVTTDGIASLESPPASGEGEQADRPARGGKTRAKVCKRKGAKKKAGRRPARRGR